jgi:hypothetical protein
VPILSQFDRADPGVEPLGQRNIMNSQSIQFVINPDTVDKVIAEAAVSNADTCIAKISEPCGSTDQYQFGLPKF